MSERLVRRRTVYGEPYYVGGHELTPVAQVVTCGKARGTLGAHTMSGWGGAFAWVRPLALLDEDSEEGHFIGIHDGTALMIRQLLVVTVAVVVICTAIRARIQRCS